MISGRQAPDLRRRTTRLLSVLCAGACLCATGCNLLNISTLFSSTESSGKSELKLPPIVASRDAVQLEILFVDRPANDALLGDSLWKQVDQIADMSADIRGTLRENGWRVRKRLNNCWKCLLNAPR